MVTPELVCKIYNEQNEDTIAEANVWELLEEPPKIFGKKFIDTTSTGFIQTTLLYNYNEIEELEAMKKSLEILMEQPYYIPEKEELLKYEDLNYFEKNEAYTQLHEELTHSIYQGNKKEADDVINKIHLARKLNSMDLDKYVDVVNEMNIPSKNAEKASEIAELIFGFEDNLRLWEYNGYTSEESSELMGMDFDEDFEMKMVEELTQLERYIAALTNLYGRVSAEKVTEIYNLQNEDHVQLSDVEKYVTHPSEELEDLYVETEWGEFIKEDLLLFEDEYHKLVEAQRGKPYYIPEQEELLKWAEPNYFNPPKEYQDLYDYLYKYLFNKDEVITTMVCEDIYLDIEIDAGLKETLQTIENSGGIIKNEKELNEIMDRIVKVRNNSRIRENRGFSPNELRELHQSEAKKIKNIGRNDPCHCGSGKKYKKCCLKKDRLLELKK